MGPSWYLRKYDGGDLVAVGRTLHRRSCGSSLLRNGNDESDGRRNERRNLYRAEDSVTAYVCDCAEVATLDGNSLANGSGEHCRVDGAG